MGWDMIQIVERSVVLLVDVVAVEDFQSNSRWNDQYSLMIDMRRVR